jgi:BirA family transcriptional regulator, biotin operon repressor / biotin---[acetyl-CoA-carboxylase] ligase
MGSTAAHLRIGDPPAPTLALVAGLAAAQALALELAGPSSRVQLKWPNDLMIGGAKLGGILLERQGDVVIVGIGINLVCAPELPDRPTTCLAALGCSTGRDALAERLAGAWDTALQRWHGGDWPALRAAWLENAHPSGTMLSVRCGMEESLTGSFAGLAEDGAALLRLADGSTRVIHAGEVELVGRQTVDTHAVGD